MTKKLIVIGSTEYVEINGVKDIPAKIDTGADTSSIWASNIDMNKDGTLSFVLFDKDSPFYTGEKLESTDYMVKTVRSSHGDEQIRYRVKLPLTLGGATFVTTFTLANRSRNNFPVLIGRHTLSENFLVDVSKSSVKHQSNPHTPHLNQELQEDPYKFHRKYLKKKGE
ncbi:ATP-dependent zinc protease [Candidatus Saccharibacteria bacterium]|nr:ATP-dependent zinc protease [Candidatus Saccharibacteria bacterium]